MRDYFTLEEIDKIANAVRNRTTSQPKVGIILGSGLGPLAESIPNAVTIPYSDLSPWPVSTVEGHQGRLVIGELEGQVTIVMQGRAHYYLSLIHISEPTRPY